VLSLHGLKNCILRTCIQYIHNEGMIHCDIRPANFLVDEYGILKLADFKFTRKIPTEPIGNAEMNTRGTPTYMAPELFAPNGVHSFQSDLWAVGCVLYQMRRGSLPFGDNHTPLATLIDNINNVEPVNAPLPVVTPEGTTVNSRLAHPPVTADLADLLQWLLEKSPTNRCSWCVQPDLVCYHSHQMSYVTFPTTQDKCLFTPVLESQ
jgi:serine/threonine protein kinase